MTNGRPLITCIMPTWNRRPYIPAAIACWQAQTYEERELLVVDDGTEPVEDLIPADDRIRYVSLERKFTCGQKRNICCRLAKGGIIAHFDDDDWSAPGRLEDQLRRMQTKNKPITGYECLYFWDTLTKKAKRFSGGTKGYVVGTSLMYLREFWEAHPFENRQAQTDNDFVYGAMKQIAASQEDRFMVARIHDDHHTSPKTGVTDLVPIDRLPADFWENERIRIGSDSHGK
jgi:glycosyltransferase involved in cell wall biosynthesis